MDIHFQKCIDISFYMEEIQVDDSFASLILKSLSKLNKLKRIPQELYKDNTFLESV